MLNIVLDKGDSVLACFVDTWHGFLLAVPSCCHLLLLTWLKFFTSRIYKACQLQVLLHYPHCPVMLPSCCKLVLFIPPFSNQTRCTRAVKHTPALMLPCCLRLHPPLTQPHILRSCLFKPGRAACCNGPQHALARQAGYAHHE